MSELEIINEQEVLGKTFRIYGDYENPLFLAKDVAEWIEHNNVSLMVKSVDEDEKKLDYVFDISGQRRKAIFLTEDGLYEVFMQSTKPIAKQLKKKVKEILKGLRKGQIQMIPTSYKEALQHLLVQIEKNEQLQLENEEMKPKVLFADAVCSSDDSILVSELSKVLKQKGINIGQNRLFEWLRNNGYLCKQKGEKWNEPTQKSMDLGLMEIKKCNIHHSDGSIHTKRTPKVTGKGQLYFVNKFLE